MTTVSLEELRTYCRVDGEDLDPVLLAAAEAAESYLETAGVSLTGAPAPSVKLAVQGLTLHWLDNPTGGDVPQGLRQLINQLKQAG